MTGLALWILLDEPVVLRPREVPPWRRGRIATSAILQACPPERIERRELISEDGWLGVCDPAAYGYQKTATPLAGDIACWRGGRDLLSRLSRYVSGCRYAHTGLVVRDGIVGHMTLRGWIEESIPVDVECYDGEWSPGERAAFRTWQAAQRPPKGYGFHNALLVAAANVGCFSGRSNLFHLLDVFTSAALLWWSGLRWVAMFWTALGCVRVAVNLGVQRAPG